MLILSVLVFAHWKRMHPAPVPYRSSLLFFPPSAPRAQKSPYKVVEYQSINVTTVLFDVHHGIYGILIGTPTPVTAPTQIVCGSYMDAI